MKISILILFLLPSLCSAGIILPEGLTEQDRSSMLRTLGFGTSSKILSDPYPLGGYAGAEVGLQMESVNTEDVIRLGNKASSDKNATFPKISLAKGLFNDFDVFFNFMPFNQGTNFSEFGLLTRWGFYQTAFFPASFSLLLHANSVNIGNLFFSQTFGADLVTGINVTPFTFSLGAGRLFSNGRFLESLTKEKNNDAIQTDQTAFVEGYHFFFGATFEIENFFIAAQLDQYSSESPLTTSSTKIGARF